MSDSAMNWLEISEGWETGGGSAIVVVDVGATSSATTTTLQSEI